jgi:uncharacterized protein (TIGR02147 family)
MQTDYRQYLRDILEEKKKQNPRFSLRGFARVLGVQATFLSYILNGKRDLSDEMVQQFIERLDLPAPKARTFELLVKLEKAKNKSLKTRILESLAESDPESVQGRLLDAAHFELIADWRHYAIFMLIDINDFIWTFPNVAEAIGISVPEVERALERLKILGAIEFKGQERPQRLETRLLAKAKVPTAAIKRYYADVFDLTKESLEKYQAPDRFNGSEVITLSEEQLGAASEMLEECFRKIFSLSKQNKTRQNVYQLGIQLVPMVKISAKKRRNTA